MRFREWRSGFTRKNFTNFLEFVPIKNFDRYKHKILSLQIFEKVNTQFKNRLFHIKSHEIIF